MSAVVEKIKTWMNSFLEGEDQEGYDDFYRSEDEYEYEVNENLALDRAIKAPVEEKGNSFKVVSHPKMSSYEVRIIEPKAFEDAPIIVRNLKEKRSVILNLQSLDMSQSQRLVDFLSGATHAIDGQQQRIGDRVFLFTPNNVSILSETEKARVLRNAFFKD